jgi:hypothetical protein
MLDIDKLREEMSKYIRSHTREQLLEWVDMDNEKLAKEEEEWTKMTKEEKISQLIASNSGLAWDKAWAMQNGWDEDDAPEKTAKVNGVARRMPAQPRTANGRFAAKKVMAPTSHATAKGVTVEKKKKKKAVSV